MVGASPAFALPKDLSEIDAAFMTAALRASGHIDEANEVVSQEESDVGTTAGYYSSIKKVKCEFRRPTGGRTSFVVKAWPSLELLPRENIEAMFVKDIKVSAEFYEKVFGFSRIKERDGGDIIKADAVDLTDGSVCLTLIEPGDKSNMREWSYPTWGVNHIGIMVGDLEQTRQRIRDFGVTVPDELLEYYGQVYSKFFDPNGSEIDIADGRWTDWDIPAV